MLSVKHMAVSRLSRFFRGAEGTSPEEAAARLEGAAVGPVARAYRRSYRNTLPR